MLGSTSNHLTRRAALAGLGAGGLGLSFAVTARSAAAQDGSTDMTDHPIVGTWIAGDGSSSSQFRPDGSLTITWAGNFVDGSGNVVFQSTSLGVWESAASRDVRFTAVQFYSDEDGTLKGTSTLEGYFQVSDDGQQWTDDLSHGSKVTDRDPSGAVISEFVLDPSFPPVQGFRIGVGNVPFPAATPVAATPAP